MLPFATASNRVKELTQQSQENEKGDYCHNNRNDANQDKGQPYCPKNFHDAFFCLLTKWLFVQNYWMAYSSTLRATILLRSGQMKINRGEKKQCYEK